MAIISKEITDAVKILGNCGLVAFPTETVYGLGADAANELAVRKVFQVKGRPADHPLIVHLAVPEQMAEWAQQVPSEAMKLAIAFWPGPLTMVLRKQPHVLDSVTGGQDTVALRIPRHPLALALLETFGGGIVAPSANKFTRISPTTASAVREELGAEVDMILDGGACEVGVESTIIDLSGKDPIILRPGMLSVEAIEAVLGRKIKVMRQDTPVPKAPGSHHVHYAPTTKTTIVTTQDIPACVQALSNDELPVVCMVHSNTTFPKVKDVFWVNMPDKPAGYAHELYRTLRSMDQQGYRKIIVEAVPDASDWDAIRDRLMKASGAR
jgi:L-threonylcarbamoyladenylate synthase